MRTRTSFRLLGTLVLLLAGGALYFLLVRARGSSSSEAGGRPPTAETAPPLLTADADRAALEAGAPVPVGSGGPNAPSDATEAGSVEETLQVRLEVPAGFGAWPVGLQVQGLSEGIDRWFNGTLSLDAGTPVLDVPLGDLVSEQGISHLSVSARHVDLVDAKEVVLLSEWKRGITLRLRPAHILTARVLSETGEPLEGVAAVASLHRTGPDAPMHDDARRWVPHGLVADRTDHEGAIRLKVADPGRYLLVVECRGRPPWGRFVDVPEVGRLDVGDVVLGEGVHIRGRVTIEGRVTPDARVAVKPIARGVAFYAHDGVVRWDGQRMTTYTAEAETDAEGRFEIFGLSAGAYELEVSSWGSKTGYFGTQQVRRLTRTVAVPDDDVDVQVRGFVLDIDVLAGEAPAPESDVVLFVMKGDELADYANVITGADGRASVLVVPGLVYTVHASKPGFVEGSAEVTAGASGGRTSVKVTLGPPRARGTVRLHLVDERDAPIPHIKVRLTAEDRDTQELQSSAQSAVHEIGPVEPGLWEMTVYARTARDEGYVPLRANVEIGTKAPTEVRLIARTGGRLRLSVRGGDGRHLPAPVTVRDADGREMPLVYRVETDSGGRDASTGVVDGLGLSLGTDVLAAGTYEVRVQASGKDPITRSVKIEAGRTTWFDVDVR